MNKRRDFIKVMLLGGTLIGLNASPLKVFAKKEYTKIVLLHTNDTHSQIDPFPVNDPKFPGMGGYARRAALCKEIRNSEKNVLLFDAGDIFQGTPYFNLYEGELELKLMSQMGYNAATIGNHEFDNGLEKLSDKLQFATFPFLCSNYDFSNTVMNGKTLPYKTFLLDEIKIGVFGLGVELNGLVNKQNFLETKFLNPFEKAAEMAYKLKKELKCDLVICLSHLGTSYKNSNISDIGLAKQSMNIDVIIGGHSHTFIDKPYIFSNSEGKNVYICQVGWGGVKLGRLDFYFEKVTKKSFVDCRTIKIFNNQV